MIPASAAPSRISHRGQGNTNARKQAEYM